MKKNNNASILIWSIFLSLIILISFLSISSKISKNLKTMNSLQNNIEENLEIRNILNYFKDNYLKNDNNEIFIENRAIKNSLKKNESKNFYFYESSTGSLFLFGDGIIFYTFGSDNGFLDKSNNSYNFNNKSGILKIENFSGITSFELSSDNKFDFNLKKYKIIKTIGNKKVTKIYGFLK